MFWQFAVHPTREAFHPLPVNHCSRSVKGIVAVPLPRQQRRMLCKEKHVHRVHIFKVLVS